MIENTLIIPDIHLRHEQAEKIIAAVKADKVIFLGDYFDDFGDDAEMVQETCSWLNASVEHPNRLHLFGNHDVHYAYSYSNFQCSGYQQWKYFIIHDNIPKETWNKLVWHHFLDNQFLLTHAGLHKKNVPENILALHGDRTKFIKELDEYLTDSRIRGLRNAAKNSSNWIFAAGRSRGGVQDVGGITWCDYEREFFPIKGINQILGHTPQGLGIAKWCVLEKKGKVWFPPYGTIHPTLKQFNDPELSYNIDLDVCRNTHYAVWNGIELIVNSYQNL